MSSVALGHHWLVGYRGGERVLQEWRRLLPGASISTLVWVNGQVPSALTSGELHGSPLQLLPTFLRRRYKAFLPLHPWAFKRVQVPKHCRLFLSSDASFAKAMRVPAGVPHVCYCHSPPRYIWDMADEYMASLGPIGGRLLGFVGKALRRKDFLAAQRVDQFIANSQFVAGRIRRFYGRESAVIYPPVDVGAFDPHHRRENFYLVVSELVPYKRVDLAIEACSRINRKLVVIGDGSEARWLRRTSGSYVSFLGRQPFSVVKNHLERCRAFLYPQIEDFGITAVEAQAAGSPVIAFNQGGALESVVNGRTGIFFEQQSVDSLCEALKEFEGREDKFVPAVCRENSLRFSCDRFRREIRSYLETRFGKEVEAVAWGN